MQATLCCCSGSGTAADPLTEQPLPFSSTPVKTPRLQELEEEDEPTLEASSSPVAPEDLDSTYDPAKSILDVTASTDIS